MNILPSIGLLDFDDNLRSSSYDDNISSCSFSDSSISDNGVNSINFN